MIITRLIMRIINKITIMIMKMTKIMKHLQKKYLKRMKMNKIFIKDSCRKKESKYYKKMIKKNIYHGRFLIIMLRKK